jgi:hypothetical protein
MEWWVRRREAERPTIPPPIIRTGTWGDGELRDILSESEVLEIAVMIGSSCVQGVVMSCFSPRDVERQG